MFLRNNFFSIDKNEEAKFFADKPHIQESISSANILTLYPGSTPSISSQVGSDCKLPLNHY